MGLTPFNGQGRHLDHASDQVCEPRKRSQPFLCIQHAACNLAFDFSHSRERGYSSVGRAVALQAIGQGFESPCLHPPCLAFLFSCHFSFESKESQEIGPVAQLVRACA